MAVSYAYLDGWKAAADAFTADLKAAADAVLPSSVLTQAYVGRPSAYGGDYPAWLLFQLTSRGQCQHAERFMPGEMVAQVLVVYPASRPSSSSLSGQAYAEEITHQGFSEWIDKLWDLGSMERFTEGFAVSSTAMGSEDEFGRSLFIAPRVGALWAHSAEVSGVL